MRLRILSDLHLETGPWTWQAVGEDLVILAGDIADQSPEGKQWRQRLWADLARASMPAIYILGNHEGYADWVPRDVLRRRLNEDLPANVRILDRSTCEIGGIRFLGCTLWTDFSLNDHVRSTADDRATMMHDAESSVSDFKYLCRPGRNPPERITSLDMAAWHQADRSWLTTEIPASELPTVVVTHFLPSL